MMTFNIDILVKSEELSKLGYEKIKQIADEYILIKDNQPKIHYVGHYIDAECKYFRITQRFGE